jgi:hypothetical protein
MWDGSPTVDMDPWSDPAHTPEIGCAIAWGNYFADILGQHDNLVDQRADTFYQAALDEFAGFCVRVGGSPEYYANSPPRMLSWMLRPSGSWSWLGSQSGPQTIKRDPISSGKSIQSFTNAFSADKSVAKWMFSIPQRGTVTLSMYHLNGEIIDCLVNKNVEPGTHSVSWNTGTLPAGAYIARLQFGEQTLASQVLLKR